MLHLLQVNQGERPQVRPQQRQDTMATHPSGRVREGDEVQSGEDDLPPLVGQDGTSRQPQGPINRSSAEQMFGIPERVGLRIESRGARRANRDSRGWKRPARNAQRMKWFNIPSPRSLWTRTKRESMVGRKVW